MTDKTPPLNIGESDSSYTSNRSGGSIEVLISPITTTNNSAESIEVDYDNVETTSEVVTVAIVLGIIIPILLVLASIVVITLVLHLRKSTGFKQDDDHSYSTLNRENPQQAQPQSSNVGLYDQIQLSPFTGQTEVIPNAEIERISTLSSHDTDNSPSSEKQHSGQSNVSTCEQPTYSVVKKSKGKKPRKHWNSAAKQKEEALCPFTSTTKTDIKQVQKNHDQKKLQREVTLSSSHTTESPEALYTAVKKKPKADKEEKVPPPPPHSVEELYTAVKKKNVKGSAMKEGTSHIPQHRVEDLYSAVIEKPKFNNNPATDDVEASPLIPPYTVEELYTAVQKGSATKGEEEVPPIPPYTVEDSLIY